MTATPRKGLEMLQPITARSPRGTDTTPSVQVGLSHSAFRGQVTRGSWRGLRTLTDHPPWGRGRDGDAMKAPGAPRPSSGSWRTQELRTRPSDGSARAPQAGKQHRRKSGEACVSSRAASVACHRAPARPPGPLLAGGFWGRRARSLCTHRSVVQSWPHLQPPHCPRAPGPGVHTQLHKEGSLLLQDTATAAVRSHEHGPQPPPALLAMEPAPPSWEAKSWNGHPSPASPHSLSKLERQGPGAPAHGRRGFTQHELASPALLVLLWHFPPGTRHRWTDARQWHELWARRVLREPTVHRVHTAWQGPWEPTAEGV